MFNRQWIWLKWGKLLNVKMRPVIDLCEIADVDVGQIEEWLKRGK